MTARPYASGLPVTIARPFKGRLAGSVAVPNRKLRPREAACRRDRVKA